MSEQWAIYWWSIIDNIKFFLITMGVCILIIGSFIAAISESLKGTIASIITGTIVLFMAVFIPLKQDLALIFAYPYMKAGVEQAAQSETVKKLSTISTKYLDKVIADLEKANGNEHK